MRDKSIIFIFLSLAATACGAFAAYAGQVSPLASLGDAEKTYYEKVFDYSMETVQPGKKYDWASYSGKGTISVNNTFISKSGATCRNFSETFIVQGRNGIDKGVGCKRRGQDGWCKLDITKEAQTCSFEDTTRMFGGMSIDLPSIGSVSTKPINIPDGGGANPNVDTNINTNVNTDVDTGVSKKDLTAKNYSNTVTGGAGKAAGSAASNGLSWFSSTFLR